jgi:3-hydroxyacyl-CoA dehydrogenase
MELVKTAKGMELMHKRFNTLWKAIRKNSNFLQRYFGALFGYAAARVPEISDQYFPVDDAMRTGYVWDYGPFEYWDLIGFRY